MKIKKKLISLIIILTMIVSMVIPATAVEEGKYLNEANQLQLLGVFQGTGNGFELDREPTRLEGLVMLIRLLGKEREAKALSNEPCPFTDVPSWGVGYANYAFKNGLTKGIGNNLFGSNDKMNAQSYITFMLRSLEYDDSKGDFTYDKAIIFAMNRGLISNSDVLELTSSTFLRDHIAKLSMLSLRANIKNKSISLLNKLVEEGAILESVADAINNSKEKLEVHFIDVGQADSILIKKGNTSMLIDGGNNSDGTLVIDYLKKQNVNSLKYVVATHPHEDHIGGLDLVIDAFEVEKVIMPNAISTTKTFEDLLDSIRDKGLSITKAKVGEKYDLNGATITILGPIKETYDNLNNYSVVVKATYGENSFLFTGDAEEIAEMDMLKENPVLLKADVLKVGHHGSTTSTSKHFLDTVNPKFAVITVGENNTYGHPHKEILDRLGAKDIKIYRTDLQGNIILVSNGTSISFNNEAITIPSPIPLTNYNIIISNLDKIGEIVTITNNSSQDVNLNGWKLLSVKGNQEFIFTNYVLKAKNSVTISSGNEKGDLVWGKGNIWNNTSSDPAVLYDANGNVVYTFED